MKNNFLLKLLNVFKGGKKSVESRFAGKSTSEIAEIMRKIRYTEQDRKNIDKMAQEFVDALNKSTEKEVKKYDER